MIDATLTRREAIAAAGIGTAAAALAGSGIVLADEAPAEAAMEAQVPAPIEYLEAEIVIVGAGGGGLCAALSAATHGAESVLVLEKDRTVGGNTLISHGGITYFEGDRFDYCRADATPEFDKFVEEFFAGGPLTDEEAERWDELTAQYEEYLAGDRKHAFCSSLFICFLYARWEEVPLANHTVLYTDLYNEWVNWFVDMYPETRFVKFRGGSGYPYAIATTIEGAERGEAWIDGYLNGCAQYGDTVQIRTSTGVDSLIVDDEGNVLGVNATAPDGHQVKAYATKGVVIAAGGFTGNTAMLLQYNSMWPYSFIAHAKSDGTAFQQGDGIRMAQAIGAAVGTMDNVQLLNQCDYITGAENTLVRDRLRALLRVNVEGERFVKEDGSRIELARALMQQTGGYCLMISDNTNSNVSDGHNEWHVPIATLESMGVVYVGDTLEELAEKFGADPAVFTATVEEWNAICESGEDPKFGALLMRTDCELHEPPFYAFATAPAFHITYGGVVCDRETYQALRYDRATPHTPIEGLFVIGDSRADSGGADISMSNGYALGKRLTLEVEAQDRTEAIEAAKQAEADELAALQEQAAAAEVQASYADGVYTGTGLGIGGEITVTVEVAGGKVSVTDISPNNETKGVGGYEAIEDGTFAELVSQANGADFDAVAGATITSNAIQTAVAQALAAAAA